VYWSQSQFALRASLRPHNLIMKMEQTLPAGGMKRNSETISEQYRVRNLELALQPEASAQPNAEQGTETSAGLPWQRRSSSPHPLPGSNFPSIDFCATC
jgi:hypothetical protein